jgi:membrane-associated PAP2 superfamily phosphatase
VKRWLADWLEAVFPATLSTAGLLAVIALYAAAVPLTPRFVLDGLAVAVFSFYAGLLLGSLAVILARRPAGNRP